MGAARRPCVALIGNMNNNFSSVTRYLRDRGHEAELLQLDDELHFPPSADSFDDDYLTYARRLEWGGLVSFASKRAEDIAADLAPYDVVIGCGSAPAFVAKAGRTLDVFCYYGSDLYALPFERPRLRLSWREGHEEMWRWRRARAQGQGIASARFAFNSHPGWDFMFDRLGFTGERSRLTIPMLYLPQYEEDNRRRHEGLCTTLPRMRAIRARHPFLVFHHVRHVWADNPDVPSRKGNEALLRGFALLAERRPDLDPGLVTFAYGPDTERSRRLVEELGISARVHWLRRQRRKDIMQCLALADIGSTEFHHSYLASGANYEVMAMAKPLLQYRNDREYAGQDINPIVNVRTPEDIARALADVADRRDHYARLGQAGRDWLMRQVIEPGVCEIERMILASAAAA